MSAYFFVWFVSVIGRILIESIKGVIIFGKKCGYLKWIRS